MSVLEYFNTIQKQEKPLKFLIAKILMRLRLSHHFSFRYKHHILRFFPTFLSRVLWIDPQHGHSGSEVEDFIWNYLKKNDVFIDIGANIGTTTLEASKKIDVNGKVFSFEPHPRIFRFLQGNAFVNKCENIELFNFALGSKSTKIYFSDNYTDESNSVQDKNVGIEIRMETLDDIIPKELKIDLMKVDTGSGYEKFVFLGAKRILENTSCINFPAISSLCKNHNYHPIEIFNILKQQKFVIYAMFKPKILTILPEDYEPKSGDYFAVKNIDEFLKRTNYKLEK